MALANVLVPNNYNLYEGTKYIPTFNKNVADTNTYTDLGSMYIRSNDGNQINVISKIRITSANPATAVNAAMSLPVAASGALTNTSLISQSDALLLATATGASSGINLTNLPIASNTASAIQLGSSAALAAATTAYNVTLNFSYNVNPVLN